MKSPYAADVTKVLAADPNARLDAKHPLWTEGSYHWGEPEMGYFLSKDEYVIRKDMSMLADAGVDVLVMDVTNAVRYWDEWDVIFPVMQKMKAEGNKVPQFCFWAFNGPAITVVQDLYEKIYKADKYKDLWFYWDGKPLLLVQRHAERRCQRPGLAASQSALRSGGQDRREPSALRRPRITPRSSTRTTRQEVKEFFTLRTMWWGYHEWAGKRFIGTEDNWSFGYDLGDDRVKAMKPDELVSRHNGVKEEAAVTPAQHPSSLIGKSWTREHGEPQLERIRSAGAHLRAVAGQDRRASRGLRHLFPAAMGRGDPGQSAVSVHQRLERMDGRQVSAGGGTAPLPFMRRNSTYFFVDQYNAEFNRCIQPMKGGYTDNYYMQMAQNIRRYKGVRPIPELERTALGGDRRRFRRLGGRQRRVPRHGRRHVPPRLPRLRRPALHRTTRAATTSSPAKSPWTTSTSISTPRRSEPLTPHTGNNWMLLLIDADQNHDTGWYGYDLSRQQEDRRRENHDADALRCGFAGAIRGSNRRSCSTATRATSWNWPCRAGSSACRATRFASISTGATIRPT